MTAIYWNLIAIKVHFGMFVIGFKTNVGWNHLNHCMLLHLLDHFVCEFRPRNVGMVPASFVYRLERGVRNDVLSVKTRLRLRYLSKVYPGAQLPEGALRPNIAVLGQQSCAALCVIGRDISCPIRQICR